MIIVELPTKECRQNHNDQGPGPVAASEAVTVIPSVTQAPAVTPRCHDHDAGCLLLRPGTAIGYFRCNWKALANVAPRGPRTAALPTTDPTPAAARAQQAQRHHKAAAHLHTSGIAPDNAGRADVQ